MTRLPCRVMLVHPLGMPQGVLPVSDGTIQTSPWVNPTKDHSSSPNPSMGLAVYRSQAGLSW
jgi:hypothetical protein